MADPTPTPDPTPPTVPVPPPAPDLNADIAALVVDLIGPAFDTVGARFKGVDDRFAAITARLDAIDARLAGGTGTGPVDPPPPPTPDPVPLIVDVSIPSGAKPTVGQPLLFTALITGGAPGPMASYAWDFGDGTTSEEVSPSHTFAAAGTFAVKVVVVDAAGTKAGFVFGLTVAAAAQPPPPPPVEPIVVATATATAAGRATFGQALPMGKAPATLAAKGLPSQCDVKVRWSDGSVKFAVMTADVPAAGPVPLIAAADAAAPAVTPPAIDAALVLTIAGVAWTARVPAPTADRWLSGPLVAEWRAIVAPADPAGNPHPSLRAIFDVRTDAAGSGRLDVTADNTLDLAGATKVDYTPTILVGGATAWTHAPLTHWYLCRWRATVPLGAGAAAPGTVVPDLDATTAAGAIPRYSTDIDTVVDSSAGPTYDLLGPGGISTQMGEGGEYERDGVLPWWVPRYLARRNPTELATILANGDLAGSWPIHLTMADGNPVDIDKRPMFWFDWRGGQWGTQGLAAGWNVPDLGPLQPDAAHTPSLAYVPYLVTGDRYYADEVKAWAAWGIAAGSPGYRTAATIIFPGLPQVRAVAWQLRNWADAAAYLPDGDPFRAAIVAKVRANLDWLDMTATTTKAPLGSFMESSDSGYGLNVPNWQYGYLALAIDHVNDLGIPGVSGGRAAQVGMAAFALQFYNSPDFPRANALSLFGDSGWVYVAPRPPVPNAFVYFPDMKALAAFNLPPAAPVATTPLNYAPEHLALMGIAAREGLPGAKEVHDWIAGQDQAKFFVSHRPGFAVLVD